MSRVSSARSLLAVMSSILLCAPATASWEDYRTDAIREGIGYRSNLIDPSNPYASSERRNFGVLLARLGMIEDWTDIGGGLAIAAEPTHEAEGRTLPAYSAFLQEALGPYALDELFPELPLEDCDGSSHWAGRIYIGALTTAHEPGPVRARLIAARHRLAPSPWKCLSADARQAYIAALGTIDGDPWRGWRDYLQGAAHFYADDLDRAVDAFARVPRTDTWVGATAAYMAVRIAFQRLRQSTSDRFWADTEERAAMAAEHESHWQRLVVGMQEFERSGLDRGYRKAVLDLRMHAAATAPGRGRAEALYALELERHFGPERQADRALTLVGEFKNYAVWKGARDTEWDKPLWHVNRLLAALVQADQARHLPEFDRAYYSPAIGLEDATAALSDALASGRGAFEPYPGLAQYAEILVAFANEDWDAILAVATDGAATSFLPDVLLLQARAQVALGDHWGAALTWRRIGLGWPALNAVSEAGRQAVKARRFADFARLGRNLDVVVAEPAVADDDTLQGAIRGLLPWTMRHVPAGEDELMEPARFLARERPIHRILREGLARFTERRRLVDIAHDPAAPPLLRWYALEPLLVASLVSGDYDAYVAHAAALPEAAPRLVADAARDWQRPQAMDKYRDILPWVQSLVANPDDAESLTTVAYFIYSKGLFPWCVAEGSLWSMELGACTNDGAGWAWGNAPISMFERARTIFEQRSIRTEAEARLLRMMIYCFRTESNRTSCLRGSRVGSDRRARAGWFRRLHEHFPEAAKETPHWY